MTDENKLLTDISRAAKAHTLLESELLQEAYTVIDRQLIEAWKATPARDQDARERIWNAVQANNKHRDYLKIVLNNGTMAKAELEIIRTGRPRLFGIA